jgi:hypothetical protein
LNHRPRVCSEATPVLPYTVLSVVTILLRGIIALEQILFSINHKASHWALAVINIRDQKLEYYDPARKRGAVSRVLTSMSRPKFGGLGEKVHTQKA